MDRGQQKGEGDMDDPNSYVIETRGLSKSFKGVDALNSLDLHMHPNSIFAFLGPNGAGKTTTIKLLLGLIRPTARSRVFRVAKRSAWASPRRRSTTPTC
jgi:ABC-type multidrug transport system ATPase subunit